MGNIRQFVAEVSPEEDILLADGLDEAFIGIVGQRLVNGVAGGVGSNVAVYDGDRCVAVYDGNRCIDIFMARDGMTPAEAVATLCSYGFGDGDPMFVETLSRGRYDAG